MSSSSGGEKPFAYDMTTKAEKIYAAGAQDKVTYWYPDGACHKSHRKRDDDGVTYFFCWSPIAVQVKYGFTNGVSERESPAHEIAKDLIAEHGMVAVITKDGPIVLWLENVVSEELLDRRKPDITATIAACFPPVIPVGATVHIEIFVTHAVDEEKRRDLQHRKEPVLEIDLAKSLSKKSKIMMSEDPEGFEKYLWERFVAVPPGEWIVSPGT